MANTIGEDHFIEYILERYAVLDVLFNGPSIMEDLENVSFKSTYSVLNALGKPEERGTEYFESLKYSHY